MINYMEIHNLEIEPDLFGSKTVHRDALIQAGLLDPEQDLSSNDFFNKALELLDDTCVNTDVAKIDYYSEN